VSAPSDTLAAQAAVTETALAKSLAAAIVALRRAHRARVAIDASDAAGKTTLADALARAVEASGRPAIRASMQRLGVVARAVSTRTAVQILAGVLLHAERGWLQLAATDMQLSLRSSLDADVDGEGAVVVPGRGFHRRRAERYRQGAASPRGYYEDSFDYDVLRTALLDPLADAGSRRYRRTTFDFRADERSKVAVEVAPTTPP
jgi:DNA polymerase III beta subunit, N-terminal domain